MVFFTVVVIIAFAGWGPSWYGKSGSRGGGDVVVIGGKAVSVEAWKRAGRVLSIHANLRGKYSESIDPAAVAQMQQEMERSMREGRFVMPSPRITSQGVENSLVFQGEAEKLGITVTTEELEQQLSMIPAFMGRDGKLDASRYEAFVQQTLTPEGFNRGHLEEILADEVRVRKIGALLASMMPPTPTEVRNAFLRERLTTEASYVVIADTGLRSVQAVSDAELKERYEAKKEFLNSPETRTVRFAAFTIPPAPDGKPAEESKKTEELQKVADQAYDLVTALQQPGVNFDEAAKAAGATLGETAQFFSEDAPPAELEAAAAAAKAAFALTREKPYSIHIPLQKGTYVLALKEIKPPEQLPLDKVRKQLEDEIIGEKADTAMRKKAADIRTKLVEARKAAQSFSEAAQSLGLKAEAFPAFSMMQPVPPKTPYASLVQSVAGKLEPGAISEVIVSPGNALIIHVDQRPAVDEKGMEEAGARIAAGIESSREEMAFQAWLADRRDAAGIKPPGQP